MTHKPIRNAAARSRKPAAESKKPESVVAPAIARPIVERLRSRQPRRPKKTLGEGRTLSPMLAVIERAADMGLMTAKTRQVGARLPVELLQQAKKRTGITSTTALLEFALANLAVDDNFATAFVAARGQLDPDLDVGF